MSGLIGAIRNVVLRDGKEPLRWLFWLLLWEVAARLIGNKFLLVGPVETVRTLMNMAAKPAYWQAVGNSSLRILGGFLLGAVLGTALAAAAHARRGLRWILGPLVNVIKAVPVASFVVLLLLWVGNRNASLFICFFVSLPVFYLNTLGGLGAVPGDLLEVARLYGLSRGTRLRALYLPVLSPFLESALSLSVGVSFKAGAAAELIGQPALSLGNGLYRAKIYLETGEIFAWTLSIVLLAGLAEAVLRFFLRALCGSGRYGADGTPKRTR